MNQKNKKINKQAGKIVSFYSGVARLEGLPQVFLHEILLNKKGAEVAFVIGFDEGFVDALFFTKDFDISQNVYRSHKNFSIPMSDKYIGRIVDGFGFPRDGLEDIKGKRTSVFKQAPPIIDREPVKTPLTTGVKIIDTSLPLGRGQRELIIGDRKLGKSTLARDIILNQKHAEPPVKCIYVICGQKEQKIRDLTKLFENNNAFLYTTIVAASANASFAEQYLAPFVGCSIGEYFRDNGQDALVIYDDISQHAKIYRDLSLLLERAPGREAYPGNIFSLHAQLLERAAKLSNKNGGGSLTALPIVETQEGDITSFIPTNIISITDGQVYLENGLFQKGFVPAVNVGLSVSRLGSQVQPIILKEVVGGVRLSLAQHKELQKLAQLETAISEETRKKIHRGDLILELLKQEEHTFVSWMEQVVLFFIVEQGFFDDLEKSKWKSFETLMLELIRNKYEQLLEKIRTGTFNQQVKKEITQIVADFKNEF